MAPLVVQLAAWAALHLAGRLGALPAAATPVGALRLALAAMFAFTALSHFLPRTRPALVRMVPPALPAPGLLVTATGVLELAGAAGLLVPPLVRPAAVALAALLVALLPANVHADRSGIGIAGRRATPLRVRVPLQLFWLGCLLWVAAAHGRAGPSSAPPNVALQATRYAGQIAARPPGASHAAFLAHPQPRA